MVPISPFVLTQVPGIIMSVTFGARGKVTDGVNTSSFRGQFSATLNNVQFDTIDEILARLAAGNYINCKLQMVRNV